MSERLEAAKFLRYVGADRTPISSIVARRLEEIADLVESHDERVTSLLTYNNTMLEENRTQRALIRELHATIAQHNKVILELTQYIPEPKKDDTP